MKNQEQQLQYLLGAVQTAKQVKLSSERKIIRLEQTRTPAAVCHLRALVKMPKVGQELLPDSREVFSNRKRTRLPFTLHCRRFTSLARRGKDVYERGEEMCESSCAAKALRAKVQEETEVVGEGKTGRKEAAGV